MKKSFRQILSIVLSIFIFSSLNIKGVQAYATEATVKGETTLNWGQFLGNLEQQGISDAKSPRTASEIKKNWEQSKPGSWDATPGTPIIVGDYVYCYIKEEIMKFDLKTGEIVKTAPAPGTSMYFIYSAYGDGKIFVPRENPEPGTCKIIAYDADTLEQLYVTDTLKVGGSQLQTPITYHDGYIYTGTYGDNGVYACYNTKDLDASKNDEVVKATWSISTGTEAGFKWNGATFVGDACIFSDSGISNNKGSIIYSVNRKTGKEIDRYEMPNNSIVSSNITYYEKNNRIYIAGTTGNTTSIVSSVEINKDGSFNKNSIKTFVSNKNGGTVSSPIIYNDRLYIGGNYHWKGSSPFYVIDANTMKEIYNIEGIASKGSAVLTTAYATKENNQEVYIYMVPYDGKGGDSLYIIKDSIGQTMPSYEIVKGITSPEYSSQTVDISKDGDLVFYNDARKLYSFGNTNSTEITGKDVFNQIDRLPDVNDFKYYNDFEIRRIKERYNSLSDTEKAKVTNIQKLNDISAISKENPVERINGGIASLPSIENITLEDQSKIQTLMAGYKKLDDDDKAKVIGYDKLLAAHNKVIELEQKSQIDVIIKDIDVLPSVENLTSDDRVLISAIDSKISNLSEELRSQISNMDKLETARKRIEAIEKQIEYANSLIKEKLEGVEVTLDTKNIILELDKALEGLAPSDIKKINNYEAYLSPAKVDLVNQMIEKYIYIDGTDVIITKENLTSIKSIIEEIKYHCNGILDSDKKYVRNYDSIARVENAIEEFEKINNPSGDKDNQTQSNKNQYEKLPQTGGLISSYIPMGILMVSCGMVMLKRRKSE